MLMYEEHVLIPDGRRVLKSAAPAKPRRWSKACLSHCYDWAKVQSWCESLLQTTFDKQTDLSDMESSAVGNAL